LLSGNLYSVFCHHNLAALSRISCPIFPIRGYFEGFGRQRGQLVLLCLQWEVTDWEIWMCSLNRSEKYNQTSAGTPFRDNNKRPRQENSWTCSLPIGDCWRYHKGSSCKGCKFVHKCCKCGGPHPIFKCTEQSKSYSSNAKPQQRAGNFPSGQVQNSGPATSATRGIK
jgi:hypothetical protein